MNNGPDIREDRIADLDPRRDDPQGHTGSRRNQTGGRVNLWNGRLPSDKTGHAQIHCIGAQPFQIIFTADILDPLPLHSQIESLIRVDFHNQRFDVNHGTRHIKLPDNVFNNLIILAFGHHHERVGCLIRNNLDIF